MDMKICAITVTYGDRFDLLSQVVDSILKQGVEKIIVVDNNSHKNSREQLKSLESRLEGKLDVVYLAENTGSANGYKTGFKKAFEYEDCDFFWLLDDDNLPDDNALKVLAENWNAIDNEDKERSTALLSLREDRYEYVQAAHGVSTEKCFGRENGFIRFHLLNLPYLIRKRLKIEKHSKTIERIKVPYAPYGGLFFHRKLLSVIGYPDEKYFLYHDDIEFSHRISGINGSIFLVSDSVIKDIDIPWYESGEKTFFRVTDINEGSDDKVYYGTRNTVYFQHNKIVNNKAVWNLHKFIYMTIIWLIALASGKKSRYSLIKKAIEDGMAGRLGKMDL
jgi:GT2 family glycosyltransferase